MPSKRKQKIECPNCGCEVKIPRATRKENAYNVFVRQAMARPDVKSLPHKQRMKRCGELWAKQKKRLAAKK